MGQVREDIKRLAVVVVTFKRQELLSNLMDSFLALTSAPWRFVFVDNENSDATREIVEGFSRRVEELWGPAAEPDALGGTNRVVYAPQAENLGGSGGFSKGVERAYELGAEWLWLMDDDVLVEPEAIARLSKWTDGHEVVQGRRYDYDGGPFYWQYRFIVPLGIYNPLAPSAFEEGGCKETNVMCFEGCLVKRTIVERIGLPDPRFFIYWDDALYGYLASKVTAPIAVGDFILRRSREMRGWEMGAVRQLNSTSDMNRYYIMRNRGFMARYFAEHGDYNRILFGLGTLLTFAKETVRLLAVDRAHLRTGMASLFRGWRASRPILRDGSWKPMPPLS